MKLEPTKSDDPRVLWARSRIIATDSIDGDPVASWCSHVENNGPSVSVADWVAFQILQGDDSNWHSAARASDREVLGVQWEQLRAFAEVFFQLPALEKRRQFQLLESSLQNNSVAFEHLERYRQFLDWDADCAEEDSDVVELMRSLLAMAVSGPLERKRSINRLLIMASEKPLRWRTAALAVQRDSRFSQMAPLLLDRIARLDPEEKSLRQIANRRSFNRRHGWHIFRHKMRSEASTLGFFLFLTSPGVLYLLFHLLSSPYWHSPRSPRSHPANYSQVEPGGVHSHAFNELLLDREHAKALAQLLKQEKAFDYVEILKEKWSATAHTQGSQGLAEIEAELASGADRTASGKVSGHDRDAILSLFHAWRFKYGNLIARRADEEKLKQAQPQDPSTPAPADDPTQNEPGHDK